jgi:putative transposase
MGVGHQALRRGRCSLRGQVYLVTFATRDRVPVFAAAGVACVAAPLIADSVSVTDARVLAWVLMPDHWHGMVELGDTTLACAVRRMKGASARRLRLAFPHLGPVWAPAYHERALRRDEDLLAAARYVVANPVRGGLVRSVRDYPFWDAVWI